jgi:serine protease Do
MRSRPGCVAGLTLLSLCQSVLIGRQAFAQDAITPATPEASSADPTTPSLEQFLRFLQPRIVKIHGAGGLKGLESYQSGFFISDQGHVLTSWSTVLDIDKVRVVTSDGKRWDAMLAGLDPLAELAVLKIPDDGMAFFKIPSSDPPTPGDRVFGISNLFGIATGDEAASVQHGVVMALSPLAATRGRLKTPYRGEVILLDAMTNNPGATGGAVVDLQGELIGIMGKELQDDASGIWINYALPNAVIAASVKSILEGKVPGATPSANPASTRPHTLQNLGLTLIPDVLNKTPPFVDRVASQSAAERSGLKPNDLILVVNGQRVDSRSSLEKQLGSIDRVDPVPMVVQRGEEIVTLQIRP